jgi:hypothetical protein
MADKLQEMFDLQLDVVKSQEATISTYREICMEIGKLHTEHPSSRKGGTPYCRHCGHNWPCPSYSAITKQPLIKMLLFAKSYSEFHGYSE